MQARPTALFRLRRASWPAITLASSLILKTRLAVLPSIMEISGECYKHLAPRSKDHTLPLLSSITYRCRRGYFTYAMGLLEPFLRFLENASGCNGGSLDGIKVTFPPPIYEPRFLRMYPHGIYAYRGCQRSTQGQGEVE